MQLNLLRKLMRIFVSSLHYVFESENLRFSFFYENKPNLGGKMWKILKISPQVIQNSRQYLLLRTDVVQKTVVGCPWWLAIVESLKNIWTVYPFHYFLYFFFTNTWLSCSLCVSSFPNKTKRTTVNSWSRCAVWDNRIHIICKEK